MKKTGAVLVTLILLLSSLTLPVSKATAVSPTPDIIGKLPPLGSFIGPTSLYFDGARLYVIDSGARRIQGLYPKSEFALGIYGQHKGQLADPSGITTYKGQSYICDQYNNKIVCYDKEAKYVREFQVYDTNHAQVLNQPRGIAQYQGKLYIANTGSGNIVLVDTDGKFIDIWNNNNLVEPTGVAVSSDKIIVTDPNKSTITIFDLTGKVLSTIKQNGCWAVSGGESKFAVTDKTNNKVFIYNTSDYSTITSFGETGSNPGQLSKPMGIAIQEDKIYVSSYDSNRVDIFDQSGKFSSSYGLEAKDAAGSLGSPEGMVVFGNKIAVTDSSRDKVLIYNKSGSLVTEFGGYGSDDKEFKYPSGIAADDTYLYVADSGNNCIKVFDYDGNFKKTIGSFGFGQGKLNSPSDVCVVDSINKLFVCDTGNNLIQEFTTNGEFVTQTGGFGTNPGKFNNPMGIATDGEKLVIADSANCRVQELLVKDLSYQKSYGQKGRGEDKLLFPTKCKLDDSGKVYVSDTYNHRIEIFDSENRFQLYLWSEWRTRQH